MIKSTGAVVVPSPDSATNNVMADIRDIRPLVDVPLGWEWLTWTVTALIGAFTIYKFWKLLSSRPPRPKRKSLVSPEQKAHQQLDAALRLLSEPKVFCSTVSDAVRYYLEERFHFRAPERTTEEFLLELQTSSRLNDGQKRALGGFLEQCDLVKFAGFQPAETELKQLHSVAHQLVDETRPTSLSDIVAKAANQEEEEELKQAAIALAQTLDRVFVKSLVFGLILMGFGLQMVIWSDVAFAREPMMGDVNSIGQTMRYMAEAVWSQPVAIALMVLGFVYLIEAIESKTRRPKV